MDMDTLKAECLACTRCELYATRTNVVFGQGVPDAEVLFVAHHGSNTSTCKELLEAITPETAVISVGYNTYGHPTQKVLDRLAKYEITVLRTDTDGEITIAAGEG